MSPGPATKEQMALQKFMLIKLKKKERKKRFAEVKCN